jgi:hypothetical protein
MLQLMLRQMLQPTPLETSSTTQLTLPTSRETPPQTQGIMQELNILQYRPIAQKGASVNIRDEVEIARRANYDRECGIPYALDANNPIQAADLQHMHDKELLRRAHYAKTMALLMTSASSRQLTPRQQARERSITSQRSHDVSRRLDTPRTSNRPLRSTTVALTQVYGSRCTAL